MEAYSSNNGKVEPVIDIYDVNLDEGEVTVALDELTGKKVEMPEVERQETDTHHLQLAMGDFGSGMDGIYRLSVHAADLAGNDDEAELFLRLIAMAHIMPLIRRQKRWYKRFLSAVRRKSLFMRTIWTG